MENMETLEQLVKLASLGTAGVCVLAVFLIGTSIFRLGNDTPEWKVSLMKKYMNTCIIIAFICTISGGANAYFNQNKIQEAENDLEEFGDRYENEVNQLNAYKTDLEINLNAVKASLEENADNPETSIQQIESLEFAVREYQIKPRTEIMENLGPERRRRIQ